MRFLNFGYYIIEPVLRPKYVSLDCTHILSASICICNLHPLLDGSFWLNHEKEQLKYQNKLKLSSEQFSEMKQMVSDLFNEKKLDIDGRFMYLEDVHNFYNKYLNNLKDLKVIAISFDIRYKNILYDELKNTSNSLVIEDTQTDGKFLGYEILGWDYGAFHSYLCNSLDKDILERYKLKVNNLGIIQNSYNELLDFVKYIKDKGEPVIWLPFAIYEYKI